MTNPQAPLRFRLISGRRSGRTAELVHAARLALARGETVVWPVRTKVQRESLELAFPDLKGCIRSSEEAKKA